MCKCLKNGAMLDVYAQMPKKKFSIAFNKVGTTE